jgi:hypothetical protein
VAVRSAPVHDVVAFAGGYQRHPRDLCSKVLADSSLANEGVARTTRALRRASRLGRWIFACSCAAAAAKVLSSAYLLSAFSANRACPCYNKRGGKAAARIKCRCGLRTRNRAG